LGKFGKSGEKRDKVKIIIFFTSRKSKTNIVA